MSYAKLKYGDLKGDSTATGFENFIDINSFSVSANRSVGGSKTSMREIGQPTISEISITKEICSATPFLFQSVLKGGGQNCEIHLLKTSESGVEAYCIYKIEDALISRCSEIDLFKKNAHCIAQIPRFHIYAA